MKKITTTFLRSFYKYNPHLRNIQQEIVWNTFIEWFEISSNWRYFYYLKQRCFNYLMFVDYSYPNITDKPSASTTLKFPHTSKLRKVKCNLSSFFQKMINEIFPKFDIVLVSNPELHECHLKCHWIEVWNKKGEKFRKHSSKFCQCAKNLGIDFHKYCKKDWHLMVRHELTVDFEAWPYDKFFELINPSKMIYVDKLNYEIDHLTLKVCYEMKTWISFYDQKSIAEFKRHGFNTRTQKGYFSYDYKESEFKKEKSKINSSYYVENKEVISFNPSRQREIKSLTQRINRIEKRITISRGEKRNSLQVLRDNFKFQLSDLKKEICDKNK